MQSDGNQMLQVRLDKLRDSIREEQKAHGVHVMNHCHGLGLLDRSPPRYTIVAAGQDTA